jgi:hypothetical protein
MSNESTKKRRILKEKLRGIKQAAKCYSQKHEIEFDEVFAPVARLETI